jgi:hypothetical protein
MVHVENKAIKELNILKKEVMKKFDKNEISEKDYKKAMEDISNLLKPEIEKEMAKEKNRVNTIKEEVKMSNVEKPKKEKPVKEPKVKKVSRQDVILKVLSLKTMNTVDKVVDKVLELRPEDEPKKKDVRVHVNWTIGKLKKGQGRFAKYNFNPENLELSEK